MSLDAKTVKARRRIEEVAGRSVALRRSGKYLIGRCPFHDDRTPSFVVDVNTQRWRCFGRCATGWRDVIDYVGWEQHGAAWNTRDPEMFKEALRALGGGSATTLNLPPRVKAASPLPGRTPRPLDTQMLLERTAALYQRQLWMMGSGPVTPLAYLHRRGFSDETIRRAGLGYCCGSGLVKYLRQAGIPLELARAMGLLDPQRGDREFFRGRILFADYDQAGHVSHLCGRKWAEALNARAPKYLCLKGVDKPLYGWGRLDGQPGPQPVFVTESLPDGLSLGQWGLDALAVVGTALRDAHARLLAGLSRPILYIPHNDGGTGLSAVQQWRQAVGHGEILRLPEAIKDVNELAITPDGREVFFGLWRQAFGEEGQERIP